MSTTVEEPWSPEPELREPTPRRLRPTDYPDYNTPNVTLFRIVGGLLLLGGVALLALGLARFGSASVVIGVIAALLGAAALTVPGRKAAQARARAERLVQHGQPVMARIVSAENLTGDSIHGRTATYMMTLPGGESIRRYVNVDERALPKRIPGNVTALIDPANTNDVELYCALPFRAVARPAPAPDPLTDLPTAAPASPTDGQMGSVEPDKPQEQPQPQSQPQSPPGYQGLPWE